jgi:hypothetical protein
MTTKGKGRRCRRETIGNEGVVTSEFRRQNAIRNHLLMVFSGSAGDNKGRRCRDARELCGSCRLAPQLTQIPLFGSFFALAAPLLSRSPQWPVLSNNVCIFRLSSPVAIEYRPRAFTPRAHRNLARTREPKQTKTNKHSLNVSHPS